MTRESGPLRDRVYMASEMLPSSTKTTSSAQSFTQEHGAWTKTKARCPRSTATPPAASGGRRGYLVRRNR